MSTNVSNTIPVDVFRSSLLATLDEAFISAPNDWSLFTDKGTSLFETLVSIDAATASRVFSSRASNIAAQVNHIRFYLDVLMNGVKTGFQEKADWEGSWKIGEVTEEEWQELVTRLRTTYQEVRTFAETNDNWNANVVGGAFGIAAHTAYHLGEIRQALAALQVPE